mgnify:CR=1 FL=1
MFKIVLISLFLLLLFNKQIFKERTDQSIYLATALVGNTGNLGIPLGIALFGVESVPYTSIINIANTLFIYVFSVYFFAREKFLLKDAILAMGYKITMAFFPPTSGHPDSARIAQNLPFYMIHFPMQASPKFKGQEINSLNITDSYETIEKRVKQLREWYPNAVYTNNHTGSVFTENEEAMDKLFKALKKYNFIFVDSRTSNKSVAKKYAKKDLCL